MSKKVLGEFWVKKSGAKKHLKNLFVWSFLVGAAFSTVLVYNSREKWKKEQYTSKIIILKKNTPWTNNLIVDRKFSYKDTEMQKNNKEQFKSKKSLTEIHLYFDVNKTDYNAFCVFSMKFLKANWNKWFLISNRNGLFLNTIG